QQLSCIGAAVPTPNWAAYGNDANIPTRCADGTTGTVFASSAPSVTLFSKNYAAPRSLRSNLNWQGAILDNRFNATVDATFSRNLNQASTYDRNFVATQQFSMAGEDNRPVYARAANIVPLTGSIAATESRVTTAYTHVSELRSDMTSQSEQLTVGIRPL